MIEFSALLTICTKLWGDYNTLHSYFADGQMVGILQKIGETDFQAAIAALGAARKSNDPSREVSEAISHFRTASIRYLAAANERRFWGLLKATGDARYNSYKVVIEASLLTGLCYRYLKDNSQAREHLRNARRYFDDYAEAELDKAWEDERISSAGIGLEATMSISVDTSASDEQDERIKAVKLGIEEERSNLEKLIEMDSKGTIQLLPNTVVAA